MPLIRKRQLLCIYHFDVLLPDFNQEQPGEGDASNQPVQEQSDDDFIGVWKDICETQQKTVSWMLGLQIKTAAVSQFTKFTIALKGKSRRFS